MTTIVAPNASALTVVPLCAADGIPLPVSTSGGTYVWTPDLSSADLATANRIVTAASSPVAITPAEWEGIEPDIAGLQAFQNLASPTLAQTVAAVKAQSRILRAILRT